MKNNLLKADSRVDFTSKQDEFTAYIRDPQNNPVPADVKESRMVMYRELFFNNIESFLSGNFPVLRKILSDQQWLALVQDFFVKHACQSPHFSQIPEEFLDYLQNEQWRLENLAQSTISTEQMQASSKTEQIWQTTIAPDLVKIAVVNPDNLSLIDLAQYIDFLKDNQQKSQTFELAFWGRVLNPLVTFVMLLVATPFVIGVKRGVNVGSRMMIGIVIGMSFNILDKIFGHVGLIYDFNPFLMAIFPSLLVSGLSFYALRRTI